MKTSPTSLRLAQLEGQRDGAHMNAVELVKHVRHLLTIIDEGYTLRPEERKAITKAIARVGKRRLPTAKAVETKVLRQVAAWIDANHEALSDDASPVHTISTHLRCGTWKDSR